MFLGKILNQSILIAQTNVAFRKSDFNKCTLTICSKVASLKHKSHLRHSQDYYVSFSIERNYIYVIANMPKNIKNFYHTFLLLFRRADSENVVFFLFFLPRLGVALKLDPPYITIWKIVRFLIFRAQNNGFDAMNSR